MASNSGKKKKHQKNPDDRSHQATIYLNCPDATKSPPPVRSFPGSHLYLIFLP